MTGTSATYTGLANGYIALRRELLLRHITVMTDMCQPPVAPGAGTCLSGRRTCAGQGGFVRKIIWSATLSVLIVALTACQPRTSRWVELENRTSETVSVKWLGDATAGRQVPPGDSTRIAVVSGGCLRNGAEDVIVGETASGRRFTFGPPACKGGKWTLPAS